MAEEPKQVKPFGLYLKTTNRGRTEADLSNKMHELIEQVLETGKTGFKIDIDGARHCTCLPKCCYCSDSHDGGES